MPTKKALIAVGIVALAFIVLNSLNNKFETRSPSGFITSPAVTTEESINKSEPLGLAQRARLSSSEKKIIPPNPNPAGSADYEDVTRKDRLIIKSGNFSIVSENVSQILEQLTKHVESINGFITQSQIRYPQQVPLATLAVRVPVEKFEDTRELIRQLAQRVINERVTGTDVTEEYVDHEARLRNLEASEKQFLEIMKRAQKIEDILQVQQQLERVRGQIETTKESLQYLERSAKLATLNITISTDEKNLPLIDPADRWRPSLIIKEASRSFLLTAQKIASQLIWIIVFSPLWATTLIIIYLISRAARKKQSTNHYQS